MFEYIHAVTGPYFEQIMFGLSGSITAFCSSLLILSCGYSTLRACNVIKFKLLDKFIHISNIMLSSLLICSVILLTLGLGCSLNISGVGLFQGTTYFRHATAYYYLHAILSISTLILACLSSEHVKNKHKNS
jgi:hypothetical protein